MINFTINKYRKNYCGKYLDTFEKINICVGYELDGKKIDYLPLSEPSQNKIMPIYEEHEGWLTDTSGINEFNEYFG